MPGAHGGKLVADAFAAAGRHDGDQITSVEDGVDGFELSGTERLVSGDLVELVQCGLGPVAQFVLPDGAGPGVEIVDVRHMRFPTCRFGWPAALPTEPIYHITEIFLVGSGVTFDGGNR